MRLPATPSQTVGPFFTLGFRWLECRELAPPGVSGERATVAGRVLDGDGEPVADALLELWQADAQGKYAHPEDTRPRAAEPGFAGYGRIATDAHGRFEFATVRPGPVPGPDGRPQAPHIVVSVFARGLLRRLVTRLYFPDPERNAQDFALGRVDPARRATLIARPVAERPGVFEWDVVLRGPGETVFFDLDC